MKAVRESTAIGAATVGTGAAVTAGIASACCVGPALAPIFVSVLGASGVVAISGLRPYTVWLLLGSAVMLAFSLRQLYRKPAACSPTNLSVPTSVRIARVVTWAALALWLVSTAYSVYGFLHE